MEPNPFDPSVDRASPDPEPEQLPPSDDTVLALRERHDRGVDIMVDALAT